MPRQYTYPAWVGWTCYYIAGYVRYSARDEQWTYTPRNAEAWDDTEYFECLADALAYAEDMDAQAALVVA